MAGIILPMENHPILNTPRLLLRPVNLSDAVDLFNVYGDPLAMRFMETPPHASLVETQAKIVEMKSGEAFYWSICLKESQKVIGNIGYLGNVGFPGMGYILGTDWWRQGYMTEAIMPALEYGFSQLDLDRVELWINQENIASQKLAHKAGFTRRGRFRMKYNHLPEAHDMWVYGLYRHVWRDEFTPPPQQCYAAQPILTVANVRRTAEYYRDTLGFTIDFLYGDPPTHAAVSCAEWTAEGARIQFSQAVGEAAAQSLIAIYLFVGPDIEARYELYRSRGVAVVRDLERLPWGMQEFAIQDCNGFVLRFGTPG